MALFVYIDVIMLTCNNTEPCKRIKTYPNICFSIKDLGPLKCFLNIEIALGPQAVTQNVVSIAMVVSLGIGENRLNTETAFHIAAKMRFNQLKNLSNAAISLRIGDILNH